MITSMEKRSLSDLAVQPNEPPQQGKKNGFPQSVSGPKPLPLISLHPIYPFPIFIIK